MMLMLPFVAAKAQIIDIRTENTQMVLSVNSQSQLLFLHYGGVTDDPQIFADLKTNRRKDHEADPMAYGTVGGRNTRLAALAATHSDGDINTELAYKGHKSREIIPGIKVTEIMLEDKKKDMAVKLVYTAFFREDVITSHSEITNLGPESGKKSSKKVSQDLVLREYYSSMLPIKAEKYLLTHFYGAWAREMHMDNTLLTHGVKSIGTRKNVRTTHTENPSFMLSLDTGSFDENCGEVIAGTLAWSGNFKLNFEVDEWDILTVTSGINPSSAAYTLAKGKTFVTPDMIYTYSFEGAGGASRNLHDWARNHGIYNSTRPVPTLLNSWEGAYFDFDTKTVMEMIDDTAEMGLEMFVLDDGWFGNEYPRNSSKAALGDWQVNAAKLPEGIACIADYAHSKGLRFGIWIEPEMVSQKSGLYERHPDWIVKAQGREATKIRNQWLLDLTNPCVQDFIFGVFDDIMRISPHISYIKWDANRHVESAGSEYLDSSLQSNFWVDYVQGFYNVLSRIREKYPDVFIQACASGGGRVEYGALKYFDECWTSDNTEGYSRVKIQYGTSMIYPACIMGSHVSAVPNHQTGNVTPLKFRFDIASSGRLGMELQPKDMTPEESEYAKRAIASYKSFHDIVLGGDLYRLSSPYDASACYSLMYVSKDKKRAVMFVYNTVYQGAQPSHRFRLRGLAPEQEYRLTELNVDKKRFWADGKLLPGSFLIMHGLNPPIRTIYDSAIYLLEAE